MCAGSAAPAITPPHSVHGGWTHPCLVPCQVPRRQSTGPGHRTAPHKYVASGMLGLAGSRPPATSYTSAARASFALPPATWLQHTAPQVVSDYLQAEVTLGRILGPLSPPPNGLVVSKFGVSKFGVIPQKHQVGKWRLILDLSSPEGASVNDGISKDLCSAKYLYFDQAAKLIMEAGVGALLSKIDIKDAYRIVPVHPEDWTLLGIQWHGQYFMDTRLPFGLRSAPKQIPYSGSSSSRGCQPISTV